MLGGVDSSYFSGGGCARGLAADGGGWRVAKDSLGAAAVGQWGGVSERGRARARATSREPRRRAGSITYVPFNLVQGLLGYWLITGDDIKARLPASRT